MTDTAYSETHYKTSRRAAEIAALITALDAEIAGEVRFSDGDRALYATDGSNYRQTPIGVVIPRSIDDVVNTVALCRNYNVPILARGGGTSLAGQCCNVAVVIDFSKYLNRIVALDSQTKRARVEPGIILDDLRNAAEKDHLTFGPDPATHNHCTLGGMIGNNSCGVHSVMAGFAAGNAGRTADNIDELEILTYDGLRMRVGRTSESELERIIGAGGRRGEIYRQLRNLRDRYADAIRTRYPKIPRRVSGYNLDELLPENSFHVARALVGSEGTCVTILEATAVLIHSPPVRSLLVLGYPDVYQAGDHIPDILPHRPTALEGLDDCLIGDMKKKNLHPRDITLLPPGGGWLLVEFGGDSKEESDAKARSVMNALKGRKDAPSMKLFDNEQEEKIIWRVRESGLGATALVPGAPRTWEGWEDSAVAPEKVGRYLRELRKLFEKHGYACSLYGHFGQGCIHTRIDFDLETAAGIKNYRAFMEDATSLVVSYGGSLSGEHGDGQSRAEFLTKMFGPELVRAFGEFKAIWDPSGKMNPGKIVAPYRIDENLRLGTGYHPPQPVTYFKFPDDNGSFAQAALRCVGVGECRRTGGGTMCPSFMATREEKHSTRGRARLLFEMLRGDPLTGGWRDEAVREALDLCLACKGCKSDCPVNVDMASYKAEFLSHYYERRLRPISAYSMGLIPFWSRLAGRLPSLVNFFTQTPGLRTLLKFIGGFARERRIPVYAGKTLKQWFARRPRRNKGGPQVLLWPDTFTNHFHPDTGKAAVEILEAAGYEVLLPTPFLCCGLPLFYYGMLAQAKDLLQTILRTLQREIAEGIPLVGLEPSCTAVFRDELINLFPHDETAKRLSRQTYLFSEFLDRRATHYRIPQLKRKAVVHMHCHHKSVFGLDAEKNMLAKLGLDFQILDSGCCGMAGAFGFEKSHYDVSLKIGERVLLPAVRNADKDALIIADGFSCREQIEQTTLRSPLHLAQVMQIALNQSAFPLGAPYPETRLMQLRKQNRERRAARSRTLGLLSLGAFLTLLAWRRQKILAVSAPGRNGTSTPYSQTR